MNHDPDPPQILAAMVPPAQRPSPAVTGLVGAASGFFGLGLVALAATDALVPAAIVGFMLGLPAGALFGLLTGLFIRGDLPRKATRIWSAGVGAGVIFALLFDATGLFAVIVAVAASGAVFMRET